VRRFRQLGFRFRAHQIQHFYRISLGSEHYYAFRNICRAQRLGNVNCSVYTTACWQQLEFHRRHERHHCFVKVLLWAAVFTWRHRALDCFLAAAPALLFGCRSVDCLPHVKFVSLTGICHFTNCARHPFSLNPQHRNKNN
jgi:hypothetical protein